MLGYSADDKKQKRSIPSGLEFTPGSNIRKGMASLRSAVKNISNFADLDSKHFREIAC